MKVISISNLIKILGALHSESVSEATVQNIMDWYSDTFEQDESGDLVKTRENSDIRALLGAKYEGLPQIIH